MKIWLLAGVSALATIATQAAAQTAPVPSEPENPQGSATQVDDIVVTGSRTIRDGAQAPTPVTVASIEQLQQAQPGLIAEAVNTLPAFRGSNRPTNGNRAATGLNSGSFLNLRNLGAQRTLVLVDGRRAAPSARDGSVDINGLPSQLLRRVDVVTGGASAAYGSDAVAGVVNFVLDTGFEGLKSEAQTGVSGQGDAESFRFSLTGGTSFADGRGHLVASGSIYDVKGLQSLADREWAAINYGILNNPAVPGQVTIRPDIRSAVTTPGGLVLSGPLAFQQFRPDGTLAPFDRGSIRSGAVQVGGDGTQIFTNLSADVRTRNVFGHATFDLSPNLRVFAQAAVSDARNSYVQVQPFNVGGFNNFTIFSGNPYLNPALQAQLTSTGTASFGLGRINYDFGPPSTALAETVLVDTTIGFELDGLEGWTLNGYYARGRNNSDIRTNDNVILENLYAAADAVRDPSGQIVCRVTLTNPGLYPGCQPMNLFGVGSPSAASVDYVTADTAYDLEVAQDVLALTARGDLFEGWAGPIAAAFGLEYREQSIEQVTDPIANSINDATGIRGVPNVYVNQPGGWLLTNVFPISGAYDLWEAFGEVAVPLARDLPLIRSLDFNGAARYTDYSTSGGVTTWKAGLVWSPVDGLRVRATQSRDVRTPNVPELFAGQSRVTSSVIENGATVGIIAVSTGNADLMPEEADTFTAGLVLQPVPIPGLTASIDYYAIDIAGVITTLSPQVTRDQCAAGATALCANIFRDSNGVLSRIVSPTLNLNALSTSGIDFELGYRPEFELAEGRLGFRLMASHLLEMRTDIFGGASVDRAGEVGLSANPDWSVTGSVEWTRGPFTVFVQERYYAAGVYDAFRVEPRTIEDNDIEDIFYTDLTASYDLTEKAKISVTVNNLFDQNPPPAPEGTLGSFYPTNGRLYDIVGRYFTARLNYRF